MALATHLEGTDIAQAIRHLVTAEGLRDVCEIGGGRAPMLSEDDARDLQVSLTINDIDQRELDLGRGGVCFDIADPDLSLRQPGGQFDLVFSRMVFEHLKDTRMGWRNSFYLLRPGGYAVHLYPTLYALPFLVNHLLPHRTAERLLTIVKPQRPTEARKFPAYYDLCFGAEEKIRPALEAIGFSDVVVIPRWEHRYTNRIPVVRSLDRRWRALAARRNWRWQTAFALTIAKRPAKN